VSELPLGAHQSIAGGTPNAVRRAIETGCTVLQVFVKNSNRWVGKPIGEEEAAEFRRAAGQARLFSVVAHSSYLINPAGENAELREKSIEALAEELWRCDVLGIPALVLHPGSRGGSSSKAGVSRVAACLDAAFGRRETRAAVLLETAAGQGAAVGASFEELRDVLGESGQAGRLGVCLDTCHVFAAGYDLTTPESFSATIERFDSAIGLDRLKAIHVNDSKKDLGSRVDRHEHIGAGKIGEAGFRLLMTEPRLRSVPKYLETPKDPDLDWDRKNLAALRRLASDE
jgi:deoxyribonuclease-4